MSHGECPQQEKCPYKKRKRHESFLYPPYEDTAAIFKSGRGPSPKPNHADNLISEFPASKTMRNKCLFFESTSPWYFLKNYYLFYLFIFGCVGSSLLHTGFLQFVASGGYSLLWCACFLLRWLLLLWSMGSRHAGFNSCGTRAQQLWLVGSRLQAQQLWCKGLVAPWHVGSSRSRDRTHVPCIGRRILNHCATREVPMVFFLWMLEQTKTVHFLLSLLQGRGGDGAKVSKKPWEISYHLA